MHMKLNNHEQSKQHAYDSFCKNVLKHGTRDFYDKQKRRGFDSLLIDAKKERPFQKNAGFPSPLNR